MLDPLEQHAVLHNWRLSFKPFKRAPLPNGHIYVQLLVQKEAEWLFESGGLLRVHAEVGAVSGAA